MSSKINSFLEIKIATWNKEIDDVRTLLEEYAKQRNYDSALGNYKKEFAELPGKYTSPTGILLIAYQNEKPTGCVALKYFEENICEMKRLYVSPKFRGMKIGIHLVQEVIIFAKKLNYKKIRLDTHPTMIAAQNIYQQEGFTEIEAYNNNPTIGIRFFEKIL